MPASTVKVGPFARGGKSRLSTKAADHDFEPEATVTPVGIFLPAFDEIFFYSVISKVTSDGLVDSLVDWWETLRERFSQIKTIVIHADNGPESHSRRTEVSCSVCWNLLSGIRSPYVSRIIHPIIAKTIRSNEVRGILEQHWNGALLDSVEAVIQYAKTMTWKGNHPVVELVTTTYQTGVKLTKEAMDAVETQLQRLPSLGKWFVDINCSPPAIRDD
jgi:hypothetical protein